MMITSNQSKKLMIYTSLDEYWIKKWRLNKKFQVLIIKKEKKGGTFFFLQFIASARQ